eukprot:jgi/Bigna1/127984/aug1.5_g2692
MATRNVAVFMEKEGKQHKEGEAAAREATAAAGSVEDPGFCADGGAAVKAALSTLPPIQTSSIVAFLARGIPGEASEGNSPSKYSGFRPIIAKMDAGLLLLSSSSSSTTTRRRTTTLAPSPPSQPSSEATVREELQRRLRNGRMAFNGVDCAVKRLEHRLITIFKRPDRSEQWRGGGGGGGGRRTHHLSYPPLPNLPYSHGALSTNVSTGRRFVRIVCQNATRQMDELEEILATAPPPNDSMKRQQQTRLKSLVESLASLQTKFSIFATTKLQEEKEGEKKQAGVAAPASSLSSYVPHERSQLARLHDSVFAIEEAYSEIKRCVSTFYTHRPKGRAEEKSGQQQQAAGTDSVLHLIDPLLPKPFRTSAPQQQETEGGEKEKENERVEQSLRWKLWFLRVLFLGKLQLADLTVKRLFPERREEEEDEKGPEQPRGGLSKAWSTGDGGNGGSNSASSATLGASLFWNPHLSALCNNVYVDILKTVVIASSSTTTGPSVTSAQHPASSSSPSPLSSSSLPFLWHPIFDMAFSQAESRLKALDRTHVALVSSSLLRASQSFAFHETMAAVWLLEEEEEQEGYMEELEKTEGDDKEVVKKREPHRPPCPDQQHQLHIHMRPNRFLSELASNADTLSEALKDFEPILATYEQKVVQPLRGGEIEGGGGRPTQRQRRLVAGPMLSCESSVKKATGCFAVLAPSELLRRQGERGDGGGGGRSGKQRLIGIEKGLVVSSVTAATS